MLLIHSCSEAVFLIDSARLKPSNVDPTVVDMCLLMDGSLYLTVMIASVISLASSLVGHIIYPSVQAHRASLSVELYLVYVCLACRVVLLVAVSLSSGGML